MNRLFVSTPKFLETWKDGGMTEGDLRALEGRLLEDPKIGDVIPGTEGLRKVRVPASGRGKRGGGRIFYRDFEPYGQIFLFYFVRKNEQDDLSPEQRRSVGKAVQAIESELKARRR